jgi:hypothetical protein
LNGDLPLYQQVVMATDAKFNNSGFRSEFGLFHVDELPTELESSIYREYDKRALNTYFIEGECFIRFCFNDQCSESNSFIDFPSCWSHLIDGSHPSLDLESPQEEAQAVEQTLRPNQIDKLVCQAIGRTLWDEHPRMTIAAMTKHKAIQEYGGGKIYKGKNTLRDWLSEVAPEEVKKPGRRAQLKLNKDVA